MSSGVTDDVSLEWYVVPCEAALDHLICACAKPWHQSRNRAPTHGENCLVAVELGSRLRWHRNTAKRMLSQDTGKQAVLPTRKVHHR